MAVVAGALRLYGPHAVLNDVGTRLLDNTCEHRTGRHEEDGCLAELDWLRDAVGSEGFEPPTSCV